jgi:methylmalonyl-CoA mutase cobalamin-binding subunit
MNKKQKAANAAFIEKIKSIGISTASKIGQLKCPGCHKPLSEHDSMDVKVYGPIPFPFPMPRRRHDPSAEESFAA